MTKLSCFALAAVCAACACGAMAGEASPRWKMFDRRLGVFVHRGVCSGAGVVIDLQSD